MLGTNKTYKLVMSDRRKSRLTNSTKMIKDLGFLSQTITDLPVIKVIRFHQYIYLYTTGLIHYITTDNVIGCLNLQIK